MTTNTTATVTPDDFDFQYGVEGAAEAFSGFGGSSTVLPYLGLKDKESEILRFLNDAFRIEGKPERVPYISIVQHSMVPTKPAPAGYQGNWPRTMSGICRHAKAFRGKFPDCWICDGPLRKSDGKKYEPQARTWALACLRQEVKGTQEMVDAGKIPQDMVGRVIGIKDKTREITRKEGDQEVKEEVKALVIVNQGYKNFFAQVEGFAGQYGTILDRDYVVTRKGAGASDTVYQIAPLDKVPVADGRVYDLRDDEFYNRYTYPGYDGVPDLRRIIVRHADDDYYGRFFDPRISNESNNNGGSSGGGQQQQQQPAGASAAQPSGDVDNEARLTSLRNRVKGTGGEATAPAAEPAPAAQSEPAAAPSGGMQAL